MSDHPAQAYIRAESLLNDDPIQFFPVKDSDVSKILNSKGVTVPLSVVNFWTDVGYGFVNSSGDGSKAVDWTNLIMSPIRTGKTLAGNQRARQAMREDPPRLPVFSGDDDAIFCASPDGRISYLRDPGITIAENLADLVAKLLEDPEFYVALVWPDAPTNS